jgi:hypothetical protein
MSSPTRRAAAAPASVAALTAAHHGGHIAGTDLLPADQLDVGGFHHRVRGFDHGHQAARFDHS